MQPKKKVLHLITKSNFGGAQRYVYDLATRTTKVCDTAVVFGGHGLLEQKLLEANVRTIPLQGLDRDINILQDFKLLITLIKLIRAEKPDIIHVNSSKIGGVGALAARLAGIHRIVFTAHGWAFNEPRSFLSKQIIKILSWLTIFLSTDVIVLSQKEHDQVSAWPCTSKKLRIIPIGASFHEYKTKTEARRFLEPNDTDSIWFGTIAELHKNKGLDILIKSFVEICKSFPNTRLIIIGGGEEVTALKELVTEQKMEGKITFVGYLSEASEYLKAFDCFILPSRKEGLPYVILEAGLASIPIIATSVGGIPEVIEDMENGILVRPNSVDELAQAMKFSLTHPAEMIGFTHALKQKITDDFSTQKMLKLTEEIYFKS